MSMKPLAKCGAGAFRRVSGDEVLVLDSDPRTDPSQGEPTEAQFEAERCYAAELELLSRHCGELVS